MSWLFRRKPDPEVQVIQQQLSSLHKLVAEIQSSVVVQQVSYAEIGNEVIAIRTAIENINEKLAINVIDASSGRGEQLNQQLERLIIALTSPQYIAPSQQALEIALHRALTWMYDSLRDENKFYATEPKEIPIGTSGYYILPLNPTYHHQLIFYNPLDREGTSTILIIPNSYAEVFDLPLYFGVRRRAFDTHVRKSPPVLVDALREIHKQLWPTLRLVERVKQNDGSIISRYWRCVSKTHDQDLPRFRDYFCMYFEFEEETIDETDIELPAQSLPPPSLGSKNMLNEQNDIIARSNDIITEHNTDL